MIMNVRGILILIIVIRCLENVDVGITYLAPMEKNVNREHAWVCNCFSESQQTRAICLIKISKA